MEESICQPEWSPDGLLYFVSDRSGWWNLYRFEHGVVHPLCPRDAEFGGPQWNFGASMYGFRSSDEIICTYIEDGISRLGRLSTRGCTLTPIETPYQEIRELRVSPERVPVLAGSPTIALELALIDPDTGRNAPYWCNRSPTCRARATCRSRAASATRACRAAAPMRFTMRRRMPTSNFQPASCRR